MTFYLESLEKEIQRIKLLQYYSSNDQNLQQIVNVPDALDEYETTVALRELQRYLQVVASSSAYIKTVSAYLPSIDRVISSSDSEFESSIPAEEFAVLDTHSYYSIDSQMIYWNDRLFLSVSNLSNKPLEGRKAGQTPSYIIGVELDLKVLREALQQFNDIEDGGALLIDRRSPLMLTSNVPHERNEYIASKVKEVGADPRSGHMSAEFGGETYWVVYTRSDYLGMTIMKYIPEDSVLSNYHKYYRWLWLFTALSVALIWLYSYSTYRLIYKPLSELVKSLRKVERGDIRTEISKKTHSEFRYLYDAFNAMTSRLNNLIEQVYKQKILAQHAQLKQLQTQIVPHFLYNSYFILHRMVLDDDREGASRFSVLLGSYLKFIARGGEEDILMSREVEHARIYAEIVSMRYAGRLDLRFGELPERCAHIRVPRLILQPIVENALEHGLRKRTADGMLRVEFEQSDHTLLVVVEDNGDMLSDTQLASLQLALSLPDELERLETTGLQNVHRRLIYRFGDNSGLQLSRSNLGGLKVAIQITSEPEGQGSENDV
ncbi:MAG TPA: histidine kinase [Paenibacillus sp.]|nr:histidine kinase [Paenibacillus sp.]